MSISPSIPHVFENHQKMCISLLIQTCLAFLNKEAKYYIL